MIRVLSVCLISVILSGCATGKCCDALSEYLLAEQHARLERANAEFKCSLDDLGTAIQRDADQRKGKKK